MSDCLAPYLWQKGLLPIARILGVPGHKGGRVGYERVLKDVTLLLAQDPQSCCTTMVDFYGLGQGWPKLRFGAAATSRTKIERMEKALYDEVVKRLPECGADVRFVPNILLHEFEALFFSDPRAFADGIGRPDLAERFAAIRRGFQSPEDIDDGKDTAPSKRIERLFRYKKVLHGAAAARHVGIEAMRRECGRFRAWLERLEALAR